MTDSNDSSSAIWYELLPNNGAWPTFEEVTAYIGHRFPGSGYDPSGGENYLHNMVEKLERLGAPENLIDRYRRKSGKLPDLYISPSPDSEGGLLARYMEGEYFRILANDEYGEVLEIIASHFDMAYEPFT